MKLRPWAAERIACIQTSILCHWEIHQALLHSTAQSASHVMIPPVTVPNSNATTANPFLFLSYDRKIQRSQGCRFLLILFFFQKQKQKTKQIFRGIPETSCKTNFKITVLHEWFLCRVRFGGVTGRNSQISQRAQEEKQAFILADRTESGSQRTVYMEE